jgi:hypothetical protein
MVTDRIYKKDRLCLNPSCRALTLFYFWFRVIIWLDGPDDERSVVDSGTIRYSRGTSHAAEK